MVSGRANLRRKTTQLFVQFSRKRKIFRFCPPITVCLTIFFPFPSAGNGRPYIRGILEKMGHSMRKERVVESVCVYSLYMIYLLLLF